jgi:hypothetical protein
LESFEFLINLFVIIGCDLLNGEAKKSMEISNKILSRNFENYKEKRIKILFLQMRHAKIKFSCELFEFNWKLLAMVRSFFTK